MLTYSIIDHRHEDPVIMVHLALLSSLHYLQQPGKPGRSVGEAHRWCDVTFSPHPHPVGIGACRGGYPAVRSGLQSPEHVEPANGRNDSDPTAPRPNQKGHGEQAAQTEADKQ